MSNQTKTFIQDSEGKRPHGLAWISGQHSFVVRVAGLALFLALASCTDDVADPATYAGSLISADPLDVGLTTATISPLQRSGIFIQLPAGLPDELASHLLARFQEASIAKQLPLARTGSIPALTIKGVARAGAARSGTAVALVWEVLNSDGKRVMLLSGEALIQRRNSSNMDRYDPWSVVDEATLENIADAAAGELASWYSTHWIGDPLESDPNLATASIDGGGPSTAPPARAPIDFTTPSIVQRAPGTAPVQQPEIAGITGVAARNATLAERTSPPEPVALASAPPVKPISSPTTFTSESDNVLDIAADTYLVASATPSGPMRSAALSERALFDVAVGLSPGDGQLSLAAAVQEALIERDISIDGSSSAYRILGEVTLQQSNAGQARVQIEWSVFTKAGTPLGLITQSNEVSATSVAGPWGDIALEAGHAAAVGIVELISAPTPPV